MLPSSIRRLEQMIRRAISQSISQNLALSQKEQVGIRVRTNDWARNLVDNVLQRICLELCQPAKGESVLKAGHP